MALYTFFIKKELLCMMHFVEIDKKLIHNRYLHEKNTIFAELF
jgi:hypothetical protein